MEELLVWVDEQDREVGYGKKMETHVNEQLHRAFSLFLFNWQDRTMLIHRRADGKYHSGGLWTNSCCSHPRKGEALREAVIRRTKEELGLELTEADLQPSADDPLYGGLRELGKFQYYRKFDTCAEHEIDHVFYLSVTKAEVPLHPDPEEMSAVKWITLDELLDWMAKRPEDFTAWFPKAFEIAYAKICDEARWRERRALEQEAGK